ncbi:MAG: dTDP-4-amino-4,6-dideoxygalactose transaminase [Pseudomonadota bacterium]
MTIPFNRPALTGAEIDFIKQAHSNGHLAGDGEFSKKCHRWLEATLGTHKALLTHSCTAALEMSALLIDILPGDEVIMPSYTFVSTANAFVLRGAKPVFVDIREDTFNLDESLVEAAVTERTKAIVPIHYAGVGCDMGTLMDIAVTHELAVIEDAAQGLLSTHNDAYLGTIGDFGALSFHETKNIISGEGGALLINNERFVERAEVIREKGTNRSSFFRGETDKYTWVDIGSSYLPSELIAAFLWAQMQQAEALTKHRKELWKTYHQAFAELEEDKLLQLPKIAKDGSHNAHIYYLVLDSLAQRNAFIDAMKARGIHCVFHYIPLHGSPYGKQVSRTSGSLSVTESISDRLVRLPLWIGLEQHQNYIIDSVIEVVRELSN